VPIRSLPRDPNLEQLRTLAKTLQRLAQSGEAGAVEFVREFHPRRASAVAGSPGLADLTRADIQLALARSYGFASWPKLRDHVQTINRLTRNPHLQPVGNPIANETERVDEFLRLACLTYGADDPSRPERARTLLAEHPELATATIHTIAAVGDEAAAREVLAADPSQANSEGGPYEWEPLLYLAYSRIDSTEPGHSTLEVAQLLLEHGGDPNAGFLWEGLTSPFTALTGCFGRGEGDPPPHEHRLELARLLLDAGADANDTQTIYNLSWIPGDDWLELLLDYGLGRGLGGPWHARLAPAHPTPAQLLQDALLWATLYDNSERVRLLLRHGVDVDGHGTGHPLMEGLTAYQFAMLSGSSEIADALAAAGADTTFDPVDAFLAACMRADRPAVEEQLAAESTLPARAVARRPQLIIRAAELGRLDAVRLLAEIGFEVNYMKRLTALHQAAFDGNLELVKLLIELGADPTIQDRSYNSTALGWAEHNNQHAVIDYLAPLQPPPQSEPRTT
jgi:Ankyrin repeats (3 copies)